MKTRTDKIPRWLFSSSLRLFSCPVPRGGDQPAEGPAACGPPGEAAHQPRVFTPAPGDPTLPCSTRFLPLVLFRRVSNAGAVPGCCKNQLLCSSGSSWPAFLDISIPHPVIQVDCIFSLASTCWFPSTPAAFGVARGLSESPCLPCAVLRCCWNRPSPSCGRGLGSVQINGCTFGSLSSPELLVRAVLRQLAGIAYIYICVY